MLGQDEARMNRFRFCRRFHAASDTGEKEAEPSRSIEERSFAFLMKLE